MFVRDARGVEGEEKTGRFEVMEVLRSLNCEGVYSEGVAIEIMKTMARRAAEMY